MALTKTEVTVTAENTSVSAAATRRDAVDVRSYDGGVLTIRARNTGTLGAQCVVTVMVSHDAGSTPSTAATGDNSEWKQVFQFGTGTVSGTVVPMTWEFGPGTQHIQVEYTGHTTNAVVVEAVATCYAYS